jgi:hypothetical protein
VHPCGRYRHNTVVFILAKEHGLKNLRTIHRLDRHVYDNFTIVWLKETYCCEMLYVYSYEKINKKIKLTNFFNEFYESFAQIFLHLHRQIKSSFMQYYNTSHWCKTMLAILNSTVSRDCLPLFLEPTDCPYVTDKHPEIFFNFVSISQRYTQNLVVPPLCCIARSPNSRQFAVEYLHEFEAEFQGVYQGPMGIWFTN